MLGAPMLIRLRDAERRPVGTAEVDPAARPPRIEVRAADGSAREVFLDWEQALDDSGCLRACVACRCHELYRRRTPIWFTPFALVLAAAGLVAALTGHSSNPLVLAALVALLVIDVSVLAFVPTRLVCYRCGSAYSGMPIARHRRRWDAAAAARVAAGG
jgi:hypothetical protein